MKENISMIKNNLEEVCLNGGMLAMVAVHFEMQWEAILAHMIVNVLKHLSTLYGGTFLLSTIINICPLREKLGSSKLLFHDCLERRPLHQAHQAKEHYQIVIDASCDMVSLV